MAKVAWENRRHPLYAWRVLDQGVCDGCALGVAGFQDWTIDGVHLCTTRLKLLALNTADAFDPSALADADALRASRRQRELRALGRLGYPDAPPRTASAASPASRGTTRSTGIAAAIRTAGGDRTAIYLTQPRHHQRGVLRRRQGGPGDGRRQRRLRGAACATRRRPSRSRTPIGAAATTCSFPDVLETDLVVLIGSNPANNQPVFMKYLYEAKRNGTKVVVVNPYLEPGLERYWVPSSPESALFGTKICDLHVPVRPGGDVAFLQRGAQAADRRRRGRPRVHRRPHRGLGRRSSPPSTRSRSTTCSQPPGSPRRTSDAFVDLYAAAAAPSSCGRWASPSTARASPACRRS